MRHVGFTGTREGMTQKQKEMLHAELLRPTFADAFFHHGDCIGADAEAHDIAERLELRINIHPSDRIAGRALKKPNKGGNLWPPKPPLERNAIIVAAADVLIACPKQMQEVLRSGTWATVRYARKKGIEVTIIYPDGSCSMES